MLHSQSMFVRARLTSPLEHDRPNMPSDVIEFRAKRLLICGLFLSTCAPVEMPQLGPSTCEVALSEAPPPALQTIGELPAPREPLRLTVADPSIAAEDTLISEDK